MTEPALVALFAAIPVTITSIVALVVAVGNARKTQEVGAKVDDNTAKTQEISAKAETLITKTAEIHVLTNDAKSKADSAVAVANETINGLEKLNAALTAKHIVQAKPPRK